MTRVLASKPLPQGFSAWLLRLPVWIYRCHLSWLLGNRFLLLTHVGRKTGKAHQTVVEVVHYSQGSRTFYVVSGWGEKSNWYRNTLVHPEVIIQIANKSIPSFARKVSPDEGEEIMLTYAKLHPFALRMLSKVMNYPLDGSEEGVHSFGRSIPIVAFQPRFV
jgi:deazaflavin-dependent oxidoreductase (nitroreductase family)